MTSETSPTTRRISEQSFELVIAILLGLASIITAWASFQSSLIDGEMAAANTQAGVLSSQAESLYLEGNQQYVSDGQLFDRLTELSIQAQSADPITAADATVTVETLRFQSMTEDFAAAMDWADAENLADPETFTHPQDNEQYNGALFSGYEDVKAEADAQLEKANALNDKGDRLTLNTVLLAISLFLFGIAALLRNMRTRVIVTGVAGAVMIVATVLTVVVIAS